MTTSSTTASTRTGASPGLDRDGVAAPKVAAVKRMLRPVALWFTRSSHRELLTKSLRPDIGRLTGTIVDIGGGRNSPLARDWPPAARRIRLDISARFSPDVQGDAQRLPFRSNSVSGAVMSEVLEHVPEPWNALAEVHRVLRPGARLCGSVPFAIGVHADPHDYYRYTAEALTRLLGAFAVVDVRPHGNQIGVAWRALNERWHWLWIINPLVRPFTRSTSNYWPVGYTFVAQKAAGEDGR